MNVIERFLSYVTYDTQSCEESGTVPTTAKQKLLGEVLAQQLRDLGLKDARMDELGYVYGHLAATAGCEGVPTLGLIAHLDTAPGASGTDVKARVEHYNGGILPLGNGVTLDPAQFPELLKYTGEDLIVTDGSTLLGADDKAGVAEIFSAMEYLIAHPQLRHGRLAVGITPDEEVGAGADHFDLETFGATAAYTVDGGELGELEYENFNAASGKITIHGVNIHPGSAKNKMKNACLIAVELAGMLPAAETPAHTEGYEGFFHLQGMSGDETTAHLDYIIRDHDKFGFAARKSALDKICLYLNNKYGAGTVDLQMKDSYYNMKIMLEPHQYLIHRARGAFEKAGVTPLETPIRGGTDGARLSYMGLPCPNLSTGGMNFHGVQEYIPTKSLEKMVEVLVNLVITEQ